MCPSHLAVLGCWQMMIIVVIIRRVKLANCAKAVTTSTRVSMQSLSREILFYNLLILHEN